VESDKLPICVDGSGHCPPEDCGGIRRYYQILKILEDDDHPKQEDYQEWLGDDYDPEKFSIAEVNQRLLPFQ